MEVIFFRNFKWLERGNICCQLETVRCGGRAVKFGFGEKEGSQGGGKNNDSWGKQREWD